MFNTWAVVILYSSMLLIIAVCVCLTLYTLRPVGVEGFSDDKSSIEFNSCKLLRRYIKMGKKEALERAILNVQSVITGWQMRSILGASNTSNRCICTQHFFSHMEYSGEENSSSYALHATKGCLQLFVD